MIRRWSGKSCGLTAFQRGFGFWRKMEKCLEVTTDKVDWGTMSRWEYEGGFGGCWQCSPLNLSGSHTGDKNLF